MGLSSAETVESCYQSRLFRLFLRGFFRKTIGY